MALEIVRKLVGGVWRTVLEDQGSGPGSTPNLAAVLAEGADAGGSAITGLDDPTAEQDAATKKYVDDNGGSVIVIGQPKADDGTTFYGLPPGMNGSATWTQVWVSSDDTGSSLLDKIRYSPLLITEAVTVTELLLGQIEQAPDNDTNVRFAIVAADTDWQPTGPPLIQEEIAVPVSFAITNVSQGDQTFSVAGDRRGFFPPSSNATVSGSTGNDGSYTVDGNFPASYDPDDDETTFTVFEAIPDAAADGDVTWSAAHNVEVELDVPVTLQPGLYLEACEADEPSFNMDIGSSSFSGSYWCDGLTPGEMIAAVQAPHVYAPLSDPLPRWTESAGIVNAAFLNPGQSTAVWFFMELA